MSDRYLNWTRISPSSIHRRIAWHQMMKNGLPYHNTNHVEMMWEFLDVEQVPYDINLDYAVLYHDAVYDAAGDKEERSAQLFVQACENHGIPEGVDVDTVVRLIRATIYHIPADPLESAIIRADLWGLTVPHNTYHNFNALVDEGKRLYHTWELPVMRGMITFLLDLYNRIEHNRTVADPEHAAYWFDVNQGISQSITMARAFTERYKPGSEEQRHDIYQSAG